MEPLVAPDLCFIICLREQRNWGIELNIIFLEVQLYHTHDSLLQAITCPLTIFILHYKVKDDLRHLKTKLPHPFATQTAVLHANGGGGKHLHFMLIMWKASTSSEVHFKRALDSLDSCMKFIKIYPNFALTFCWSIIFGIIRSWWIHWACHMVRMKKVKDS